MRIFGTSLAILAAMAVLGGDTARAGISARKDSADFANKSNGDQIWDGSAYVGDWDGAAASGGTTADYSLNGSNLVINQTTNNGWLQQDNGTSPWESLTENDSWTIEASLRVADGSGASLWGAVGPVGLITVNGNGIAAGAGPGTDLDDSPNSDDFHLVRLAYDQPNGMYSVWRDGLLLTDSLTATLNFGNTRLIVGDCCSSYGGAGNNVEIEYVRYDTTGAFAPIPEPSSLAAVGLVVAGVGIARRRF